MLPMNDAILLLHTKAIVEYFSFVLHTTRIL